MRHLKDSRLPIQEKHPSLSEGSAGSHSNASYAVWRTAAQGSRRSRPWDLAARCPRAATCLPALGKRFFSSLIVPEPLDALRKHSVTAWDAPISSNHQRWHLRHLPLCSLTAFLQHHSRAWRRKSWNSGIPPVIMKCRKPEICPFSLPPMPVPSEGKSARTVSMLRYNSPLGRWMHHCLAKLAASHVSLSPLRPETRHHRVQTPQKMPDHIKAKAHYDALFYANST